MLVDDALLERYQEETLRLLGELARTDPEAARGLVREFRRSVAAALRQQAAAAAAVAAGRACWLPGMAPPPPPTRRRA